MKRLAYSLTSAPTTAGIEIDVKSSFCIGHLVLEAITHAAVAKRIIYSRRRQGFIEGKKTKFGLRLNCTDAAILCC